MIERIKTERAEEAAKRAEAEARKREAEVRDAIAQRRLAELRGEMLGSRERVLGIGDPDDAFQLRSGDLALEEEDGPEGSPPRIGRL